VKKILFISVAVILAIGLGLAGCAKSAPAPAPTPAPAKVMTLDYECWLGPMIASYPSIQKFFEGLEEATGGQVKTEFHMSGSMGKLADTYSRTISGVNDIGHISPEMIPGLFPISSIFSGLFRFEKAEDMTKAILEMQQKDYIAKEFADVKVLSFYSVGTYVMCLANDKITSVEEFKGKKIRSATETQKEVLELVGAVPVAGLQTAEIYIGLQKGIIDGVFQPWMALKGFKLNEVTKYVLALNMFTMTHAHLMNKDTWEALPQAGKDYINENIVQYNLDCAKANDTRVPGDKEFFTETPGREILSLSTEEVNKLDKVLAPVWPEWIADQEAKGLPGNQAAKDFYDTIKRLGLDVTMVGYIP